MLGVANTPIVYLQMTFTSNATFATSPNFVFNFPAALSGNAYVVVSGSSIPNGWNEVAGPGVYSNSNTTLTFAPITQSPPVTLNAGVVYTFALVTTGSLALPTPTPVPTATPVVGQASPLPQVTMAPGKGWAPFDVATAFKFPVQSGYNGQGMTVAIIGDVPPAMSDLQAYLSAFQIPGNPLSNYSVVNVVGASGTDTTGGGEATLDVETVLGLAPGANVVFYNTNGDLSNAAFLAAEKQVAASNGGKGPEVFSESFGGCENESGPSPMATPLDVPVFAGMNANGTAITVSAGDEGDNCSSGGPSPTVFGVDYPGSDPSVVSVGGTETASASYLITNPVAWNDLNFCASNNGSTQCATGGGVSDIFTTLPTYQTGVTGLFSSSKRNTPDIAMPAEDVVIYLGGPHNFAGTSWSAPEMAAMMADLDEYCGGGRPANAVAEFYKAYANSNANFLDVTSGNNEWHTDSGITYQAHAGYDNVSGLGEPYGMNIAGAMCPSKVWTSRAAMRLQSQAYESYGEQHDTVLPFARRFDAAADLGERNANESANVMLVLRNTPTMAADSQTVISALRSAGLNVTMTSTDHSLVQVNGQSSAVNSYFRTSLHNVSQGKYGVHYVNATAMTLPAAIAPYVGAVLADNLVARIPLSHRNP